MRDQLLLLATLQQLDNQLQTLTAQKDTLPQQLQTYEMACTQEQHKLERLQAEIVYSERQQRTMERELVESQGALTKTQVKLREVKTNKEYSAVMAEVALAKQRITDLEDRILQCMEQIEEQRQHVQTQEQVLRDATHTLQEQSEHMRTAQEALMQQIAAEQEQRQQTALGLDTNLYDTYQQLATRYGGRAVVQLRNEVCEGCHLRVSPQLTSDIRLQQKLHTCPHCRLLLLWLA